MNTRIHVLHSCSEPRNVYDENTSYAIQYKVLVIANSCSKKFTYDTKTETERKGNHGTTLVKQQLPETQGILTLDVSERDEYYVFLLQKIYI